MRTVGGGKGAGVVRSGRGAAGVMDGRASERGDGKRRVAPLVKVVRMVGAGQGR